MGKCLKNGKESGSCKAGTWKWMRVSGIGLSMAAEAERPREKRQQSLISDEGRAFC
jgi:hypothetical protein